MARVVFENVTKEYAAAHRQKIGAVRGLNLTVEDGKLLVIVGPSGCGKTTTLRLLAGLETPDQGDVLLDGKSLAGVAPKDRDVAMVFQDHALFPHLTVYENVALGLMLRKFPATEIKTRVTAAAEMLGLTKLLERRPGELSGGECQRAALGRALVRQPRVFLLDEPLSNLDAPLRLQLRGDIAAVRRRAGATMIFVTHDQAEALAMSDLIAVMDHGRVAQMDEPRAIYFRPANEFVARFIGAANLLHGTADAPTGPGDLGSVVLDDGDRIRCVFPAGGAARSAVTVSLRPESLVIGPGDCQTDAASNTLAGIVVGCSFLGGTARYDVRVKQRILRVTAPSDVTFPDGTPVHLTFALDSAVVVG